MRKLIFFDVDGTLVSYSTNPHHIPEPTLDALRLLKQNGHILSLSTGRSLATARLLMRELGFDNAVLCSGGHIVSHGMTLSARYIQDDVSRAIAKAAVAMGCDVFGNTEKFMYTNNTDNAMLSNFIREQSGWEDVLRPLDEMKSVCMMNIYGRNLPEQGMFSSVDVAIEHDHAEVRPAGVSKAYGVKFLSEYYGIPIEDTVAVGDGNNDIEMLLAANTGIAVGNGTVEAKSAADIIAEPIDDGGIFKVFRQLELI